MKDSHGGPPKGIVRILAIMALVVIFAGGSFILRKCFSFPWFDTCLEQVGTGYLFLATGIVCGGMAIFLYKEG